MHTIIFNSDGDTYRGRWHFNEAKQCWQGNPVKSAEVDDIISSLKHRASTEGNERKHAKAMTKEYMARLFDWSRSACPELDGALRWLQNELAGGRAPSGASKLCMTASNRALVTRHLEQLAFSAAAWTLWTR